MSHYPPEIQQFRDALLRLPGVKDVEFNLRSLDGLGENVLSLPGEFGNLPHAALRRTKGGLANEILVTAEIRFTQDGKGWIALEFLAWWVRDLSRSGEWVQMRPLALPPRAYGTQLGRVLTFAIEFFFINPSSSNDQIFRELGRHAESLNGNLKDYAREIANPTQLEQNDLDSIQRCAEVGDASAEYQLALRLANGDGVPKDDKAAFAWFKKSAEHHYPYGHHAVGNAYFTGRGVEKNLASAFEHYKLAAATGIPDGQFRLALCYQRGQGVARDLAQAAAFFTKAAEQSHPPAMRELGRCFAQGIGIAQDLKQAFAWYLKAAQAGDPSAMGQAGECLVEGKGVNRDLQQGVEWYRRGAEAGDIGSQAEYGNCFLEGKGVAKDLRQSLYWFQKALDQGFDPVKEVVADLKRKLASQQE